MKRNRVVLSHPRVVAGVALLVMYGLVLATEATQFFCRASHTFSYERTCVRVAGWTELIVAIGGCALSLYLLVRQRADVGCGGVGR